MQFELNFQSYKYGEGGGKVNGNVHGKRPGGGESRV